MNTSREDLIAEVREIAQQEETRKKQQEDTYRLNLTVRSEFNRTKNFHTGDPKKMTRRKLMQIHNLTTNQINKILGVPTC